MNVIIIDTETNEINKINENNNAAKKDTDQEVSETSEFIISCEKLIKEINETSKKTQR